MSLSIFENHVFILTQYANIQKIIPSIFISSAHKLTLALIIITLLMITILGLILLKIQKIFMPLMFLTKEVTNCNIKVVFLTKVKYF